MAVPADPTAHLKVVQAHILGVLIILSNAQSASKGCDFGLQTGTGRGKDEIIGQFRGRAERATDEQRVPPIVHATVQHWEACPVEDPGSFGPFASARGVARSR